MTGLELWKGIQQKAGYEYSRYYDAAKANRLVRDAVIDIIWQKVQYYRQTQKIADEIQPLIVYPKTVSVTNNKIPIRNLLITGISYSGASVIVTLDSTDHNLSSGQSVTLIGVQGLTGLDTVVTITATSTTSISFTNSVFPSGTYTANSGQLTSDRIVSDYWYFLNAKLNFPSQGYYNYISGVSPINAMGKFFDQPTARKPQVELANNYINILPSNIQCAEAQLYYVKQPPFEIDTEDDIRDLSLWVNTKMLSHIQDVAVRNWKSYQGDGEGMQREQMLIVDNP